MGVFIGQEYTVPSVKEYTMATLYYLNTKYMESGENVDQQTQEINQEDVTQIDNTYMNMIYDYVRKYVGFNQN
jgi:hypothetical protein